MLRAEKAPSVQIILHVRKQKTKIGGQLSRVTWVVSEPQVESCLLIPKSGELLGTILLCLEQDFLT